MTYEERMDQLEKRLALLKRYNYLLWIVILVTWGGCMAFSGLNTMKINAEVEDKDSKIVTANKFRLVDKDGKIRGYWGIVDSLFSELCLVGEDSKAYIALQVHKEGERFIPSLKISNGKGHTPGIALLESISGPSLVFWDRVLLNFC